jgi:hypothetical protein
MAKTFFCSTFLLLGKCLLSPVNMSPYQEFRMCFLADDSDCFGYKRKKNQKKSKKYLQHKKIGVPLRPDS